MSYLSCRRTGGLIPETSCAQIILASQNHEEIAVCNGCQHGRKLVATCEYKPSSMAEDEALSLRNAKAVLPRALDFVISNYPNDRHVSLRMLAQVAGRFGFDGGALPLTLIAREEPALSVANRSGQQVILVTKAARKYAQATA